MEETAGGEELEPAVLGVLVDAGGVHPVALFYREELLPSIDEIHLTRIVLQQERRPCLRGEFVDLSHTAHLDLLRIESKLNVPKSESRRQWLLEKNIEYILDRRRHLK